MFLLPMSTHFSNSREKTNKSRGGVSTGEGTLVPGARWAMKTVSFMVYQGIGFDTPDTVNLSQEGTSYQVVLTYR